MDQDAFRGHGPKLALRPDVAVRGQHPDPRAPGPTVRLPHGRLLPSGDRLFRAVLPRRAASYRGSPRSAPGRTDSCRSPCARDPHGDGAYHRSVPPDAPEGWQRDQELKETLDAPQAALEEGGPAAGHLFRPAS